jgi:hypothetical protein
MSLACRVRDRNGRVIDSDTGTVSATAAAKVTAMSSAKRAWRLVADALSSSARSWSAVATWSR